MAADAWTQAWLAAARVSRIRVVLFGYDGAGRALRYTKNE
jgi:hypothetical protein